MELLEWRGVLPGQRGHGRVFARHRLIRRNRLHFGRKRQIHEQN